MLKHAETFHANKGCNLAIVFFIPFRRFQNRNLGSIFRRYLHENVVQFLTWLRSGFSKGSVFSSGPGLVFRQCPKRLAVLETSKTEWTH